MLIKWQSRFDLVVFFLLITLVHKSIGADGLTWAEAFIQSVIPAALGYFAGWMMKQRYDNRLVNEDEIITMVDNENVVSESDQSGALDRAQ